MTKGVWGSIPDIGEFHSASLVGQLKNGSLYFLCNCIVSPSVTSSSTLVPDFEERGRVIMKRVVFTDEHVEMLVAGLREAGLEIAN
jgi:hypothetical protein